MSSQPENYMYKSQSSLKNIEHCRLLNGTISKLFLAAQHHIVLIIVLVLAILLLGQHSFTTKLIYARVFLQIWGRRY